MMHAAKYFLLFSSFILLTPCFAQTTETIQIDTYYPAPYGVYAELTTTSNTYLATEGGNVGIGTTSPGVYDSENVKVDIGVNSGSGYVAADDVYMKNPQNGNPRWASESINLSLRTFSVGCWGNPNFGRWHYCYISNVPHNDDGDDSDFVKRVYYDNDPDVEQKRTWHGYSRCDNDRAGFDAICVNLF